MITGISDVVLQPWFLPSLTILAILMLLAICMIPVTIIALKAFPKTARMGTDLYELCYICRNQKECCGVCNEDCSGRHDFSTFCMMRSPEAGKSLAVDEATRGASLKIR